MTGSPPSRAVDLRARRSPAWPVFYVYILTNDRRTVIYVGVTNDLARRLEEHRAGEGSNFTRRYNVHNLVWYEGFKYVEDAISMEMRIKGWRASARSC